MANAAIGVGAAGFGRLCSIMKIAPTGEPAGAKRGEVRVRSGGDELRWSGSGGVRRIAVTRFRMAANVFLELQREDVAR